MDVEMVPQIASPELARRLQLLVSAVPPAQLDAEFEATQLALSAEQIELSVSQWEALLEGTVPVCWNAAVLVVVAEHFAVPARYLTSDVLDVELELLDSHLTLAAALAKTGGEIGCPGTLKWDSPKQNRAIAGSLLSVRQRGSFDALVAGPEDATAPPTGPAKHHVSRMARFLNLFKGKTGR